MAFSSLSNNVLADLGSANFPTITFLTLQNYGFWADSSGFIGMAAAGQEVLRVDSTKSVLFSTSVGFSSQATPAPVCGICNFTGYLVLKGGSNGISFLTTGEQTSLYLNNSAAASFYRSVATQRFDVASAATITALDSTRSFVFLTGVTATTLQGIQSGQDGQILKVVNLTGSNMTIANENAGATAANRITTMTGADVATTGNGCAEFIYNTSTSRWNCLYVTA